MMWELLRELLKHESFLAVKYKAKGILIIKPSTIALCIIGVLYLLSPIDLIPELWIHPKVFGFIEDIIVIALVAMYAYSDVGGVFVNAEVRTQHVPVEAKPVGAGGVFGSDGSSDSLVAVPSSVPRERGADSLQSYIRDNAVPIDDSSSSAPDSGQIIGDESRPLNIYDDFLKGASKVDGGEGSSGGQRGLGDEDNDRDKEGI